MLALMSKTPVMQAHIESILVQPTKVVVPLSKDNHMVVNFNGVQIFMCLQSFGALTISINN